MTATGTAEPGYRLVLPSARAPRRPVLDPTQQAVVDHPGGPLLVLAGPGTGKTTTIVEAVARRMGELAAKNNKEVRERLERARSQIEQLLAVTAEA